MQRIISLNCQPFINQLNIMKNRTILILTISLIALSTACKKNSAFQNNGIAGKWKFVEQFDGYANGGTFTWYPIPDAYSNILTLSENGQYSKKANLNGTVQECVGTYSILNSINLEVNSNCNTITEKMIISELTTTLLIIDQQGIEGKIRYKYVATQ